MRGADDTTEGLFSYVSCEARVPADHPLRAIRAMVDEALEVLSPEFERLYATVGQPSIPPEKLPAQYQYGMVSGLGKLRNLANGRYPHIRPSTLREYVKAAGI